MTSRQSKKAHKILLVSYYYPTRAHAGGLRILDMYAKIKEKNPNTIVDLFSHERPTIDWNTEAANNIFDNIYISDQENLNLLNFQKTVGQAQRYNVVDLQFHQCGEYVDQYKTISDKVLFTPMECLSKCFYLNIRPTELLRTRPTKADLKTQWIMAKEEVRYSRTADMTVCVSETDASFLKRVSRNKKIQGLETGISEIELPKPFSMRFKPTPLEKRPLTVLYVAYFGSHTNVAALRWLLDNVHPLIKKEVNDYKLQVVGRGDLSLFKEDKKNNKNLHLVGEVKSLEPYIRKARVGIAPALSGSGFRGKINQYGIYGLPSVASKLAVKGLSYTNEVDILTAQTAEGFAQGCVRLLTDDALNKRLGEAARKRCLDNYTWQSKWKQIEDIYDLSDKALPIVTINT